ncbi:hypothetical protein AWW67_08965 [Roseivirga seohaensis]|uniref:Uncharacterized protein n=1 Tax=Roseivirga seohaensis TaxID=1914963 RepID=A0A150XQH1_9BACT|nr:hypothetical protein AWW67_08965 [Roseivirga seohaensis]
MYGVDVKQLFKLREAKSREAFPAEFKLRTGVTWALAEINKENQHTSVSRPFLKLKALLKTGWSTDFNILYTRFG